MSRPLRQGAAAVAEDISTLARIMKRVECDPRRPTKEREALVGVLRKAIVLLTNGDRTAKPKRAA